MLDWTSLSEFWSPWQIWKLRTPTVFLRGAFRVGNLATKIKDLQRLTRVFSTTGKHNEQNSMATTTPLLGGWHSYGAHMLPIWIPAKKRGSKWISTHGITMIIGQASTKLKPLTSSTKPRLSSLHIPHNPSNVLSKRYILQVCPTLWTLKRMLWTRFFSNMLTVHSSKLQSIYQSIP